MGQKLGIQFSLRRNPFQENGKYIANTVTRSNMGLQEIVRKMSVKGTTLTEVDIRAVIVLFRNEIIEALLDGNGINIDSFFSIKPSVGGVYDSPTDSFDRGKHSLSINMIPSGRFISDFERASKVERIDKAKKTPDILIVYDGESKSINQLVTVNSLIRLEGKNLAFDAEADDEGLYLHSEDGLKSVKVNYTDTIRNKELRFILPPEVTELGDVINIEVRTRLKTKILKKGGADFMLNVKAAFPKPVTP